MKFWVVYQWIEVAQQIIAQVKNGMIGRMADLEDGTLKMLLAVAESGNGDHLEIGTLFGGSAVAAVMMKKSLGLQGRVVCLDPLDGFYIGSPMEANIDPVTRLPINAETVWENAGIFDVADRLEIIQKRSSPWPKELHGRQFASAYIDGDHWGDSPLDDWQNAAPSVRDFIIFDNYAPTHPDVMRACKVTEQYPDWECVYAGGITFIVERINDVG